MFAEKLDLLFPWIVMAYGATLTATLNSRRLMAMAETRLPAYMNQQLNAHRTLGLVCLVVGALWTLQNLWL